MSKDKAGLNSHFEYHHLNTNTITTPQQMAFQKPAIPHNHISFRGAVPIFGADRTKWEYSRPFVVKSLSYLEDPFFGSFVPLERTGSGSLRVVGNDVVVVVVVVVAVVWTLLCDKVSTGRRIGLGVIEAVFERIVNLLLDSAFIKSVDTGFDEALVVSSFVVFTDQSFAFELG